VPFAISISVEPTKVAVLLIVVEVDEVVVEVDEVVVDMHV